MPLLLLAPSVVLAENRPDRILGDFEGSSYEEWKVEGDLFGTVPMKGENRQPGAPHGYVGQGLVVSSREDSTGSGRLTSPEFEIDRPYLNFLIGGQKGGAKVNLLVGGKVMRSAQGVTGDELFAETWDLADLQGKKGVLEIRDVHKGTGKDGYILADHFVLSDVPERTTLSTDLALKGAYLKLPSARTGRPCQLTIEVDGKPAMTGEFLAARGEPDFWLTVPLGPLQGKNARLILANAPRDASLAFTTSDEAPSYETPLRPQFHFSPASGFNNDPNGMVYLDGEYHLFFQYNPFGLTIGNQAWGHAVSRDLVHWHELQPVMLPWTFSKGKSYSGSAVVDRQNRAGFGRDALIAIYTDTEALPAQEGQAFSQRAEVLAYSSDRGRSFTYYSGNPVVRHLENGRDPKVFWYPAEDTAQVDPKGHWVMVVFSLREKQNGVQILVSQDLKEWTETQWLADFYECPELYKLPVSNAPGEAKWIMQGGNGDHLIGDFDGQIFTAISNVKQSTVQLPSYASQRFNDAPGGRVIQIGWIRRHTDWGKESFSQMMGVPLEFQLKKEADCYRLLANPVKALATLRGKEKSLANLTLGDGGSVELSGLGALCDIEATVSCPPGSRFRITVGKDRIEYADGKLNGKYDLPAANGDVTLRVLIDRPLIEVIGNEGAIYLPMRRESQGEECAIRLSSEGGPSTIKSLHAWPLSSIWLPDLTKNTSSPRR